MLALLGALFDLRVIQLHNLFVIVLSSSHSSLTQVLYEGTSYSDVPQHCKFSMIANDTHVNKFNIVQKETLMLPSQIALEVSVDLHKHEEEA